MMVEILSLLLQWWALGLVAIFGVCVVGYLAGKVLKKLRLLKKSSMVVVAIFATLYGGSKTFNLLPRFTADDGLTVVKAELTVPTNGLDCTIMSITWVGPDAWQPLHVRQSVSEPWINFLGQVWEPNGEWWEYEPLSYANGTNSASWYAGNDYESTTNVTIWAKWHLGSDLPPIEVEGDGVTIEDFSASSTNVVLTYAIERAVVGSHVGTARVELQEARGAVWMEVSAVTVEGGVTNTVTFPGFWIGKDTRWRVRLEVEQ